MNSISAQARALWLCIHRAYSSQNTYKNATTGSWNYKCQHVFALHSNSCSLESIYLQLSELRKTRRIDKASHSVLKTQYRPNVGPEFINSVAFEFFIISSTKWESRIKTLRRTLHFPQDKAALADSPHAPLTHGVGVRGLTKNCECLCDWL